MTRQNIFEILKEKYNVSDEMNKIKNIFENDLIVFDNDYDTIIKYSIEDFFDEYLLENWKQRGCFLSIKEMSTQLNLPHKFFKVTSNKNIIMTLEYYHNIFYLIVEKFRIFHNQDFKTSKNFRLMLENSHLLLEYLNYKIIIDRNEEKLFLIPKNPAATTVAEISSEDTALAILKYNHASMKGDLEGKRNLLFSIYREYEPLLKQPIEGYADFYNKARGLYNTLDIRHNNKTKEGNKNNVIDISDEELEKWYDELYQLLLFCVLIKDNLERKKEVDEFLKSIKGVKA
ncbi:MAG: hypothetical protein E7Z93_03680 [Cyanobacteria bacterium SIG32]|nr:hypothetical protein [Cyanobacteria bacterium SIG32]